MALHLRKNQYRGVNAHLHSRLQNIPEGWQEFHAQHIVDIARTIYPLLPPGYAVFTERSFQIRAIHPDTGEEIRPRRRIRPDVAMTSSKLPMANSGGNIQGITAPTLTLPASAAIDEEEIYLTAAVIRKVEDDEIGTPVTWVELLSPTNKPGGSGFIQYSEKRLRTFQSGITMVEIDYLHQSRPVIRSLPSYPDSEPDSHTYTIVVTTPLPSLAEGKMLVYGFDVNSSMPIAPIPLSEPESITLNFGTIYRTTYESTNAFNLRVDYEQLPERLETYSPDDQERIRQVMARAKTSPF